MMVIFVLKVMSFVSILVTCLFFYETAFAHGFGQRYDLPVPLNIFLIGSGATVAVSFIIIGLFAGRKPSLTGYSRLNLLEVKFVGPFISSPIFNHTIRFIAVAIFLLVLIAGFIGTNQPIDNLSPTFVWIIWWVGMGYLVALFGNIWQILNPWKIIYEWTMKCCGKLETDAPRFEYPQNLSVWPAVVLFFLFAWLENVYAGASRPFSLSVLIILYSSITIAGMAMFGKHQWLRHGEVFSVLFGIFSKFSPTEVRVINKKVCHTCRIGCVPSRPECVDCYQCFERSGPEIRQFNLRPFAVGLSLPQSVSTAQASFVILALATVTFDGFQDTSLWMDLHANASKIFSGFIQNTSDIISTVGLIGVPLLFFFVYFGFSWSVKQVSRSPMNVLTISKCFVFSLVPIALAYNLAHFISFLVLQGQLIIPLISDPFGFGWDIFGTADHRLNLNAINARIVWYISVSSIVIGHIISLYIGHVIALRVMPNHSSALKSQYPMLVLMVFYTATSLWIIAQPIVQ